MLMELMVLLESLDLPDLRAPKVNVDLPDLRETLVYPEPPELKVPGEMMEHPVKMEEMVVMDGTESLESLELRESPVMI